ncbi:MAG: sugar transferase [Flavobacteriales bacterium]|nr:sugar transferase [Flavobacteriales bacterium]
MLKRIFDIVFSVIGLLILLPVFIIIAVLIIADSKGGVFYKQIRVGKNQKNFYLYKFRSMQTNADKKGLLTVGMKDLRITHIGYFLRKYKLDELPQLLNVLTGKMSFVGPRPEVPKYVALYNEEQKKALDIKPGITDYASLKYFNENEVLANAKDAEQTYINEVMPEKLKLNLEYIKDKNFITDLKIIFKTLLRIIH